MPKTDYIIKMISNILDDRNALSCVGDNLSIVRADKNHNKFTIKSYGTVIGCIDKKSTIATISNKRYSATTTRHQDNIVRELEKRGYKVFRMIAWEGKLS